MIRKSEPLSMSEALGYLDKKEDAETIAFLNKFSKIKTNEAKELKDKILKLDLMQIKDEHITKIIDLMPENSEELNKILIGVSLNEDETKKVLDIIKEFK